MILCLISFCVTICLFLEPESQGGIQMFLFHINKSELTAAQSEWWPSWSTLCAGWGLLLENCRSEWLRPNFCGQYWWHLVRHRPLHKWHLCLCGQISAEVVETFIEEQDEDVREAGRGGCVCAPAPTISLAVELHRRMNTNALPSFCQFSSKKLLFQTLLTYILKEEKGEDCFLSSTTPWECIWGSDPRCVCEHSSLSGKSFQCILWLQLTHM